MSFETNQLKVDLDVQSFNRKYDRTKYFDISAYLTVDFMGELLRSLQLVIVQPFQPEQYM